MKILISLILLSTIFLSCQATTLHRKKRHCRKERLREIVDPMNEKNLKDYVNNKIQDTDQLDLTAEGEVNAAGKVNQIKKLNETELPVHLSWEQVKHFFIPQNSDSEDIKNEKKKIMLKFLYLRMVDVKVVTANVIKNSKFIKLCLSDLSVDKTNTKTLFVQNLIANDPFIQLLGGYGDLSVSCVSLTKEFFGKSFKGTINLNSGGGSMKLTSDIDYTVNLLNPEIIKTENKLKQIGESIENLKNTKVEKNEELKNLMNNEEANKIKIGKINDEIKQINKQIKIQEILEISNKNQQFNENFLSEYDQLAAVSIFISEFNKEFQRIHQESSLHSFDVNLYSRNFGYYEIINDIILLQKDAEYYEMFLRGNRLSVLSLIYNDGLTQFKDKTEGDINIDQDTIDLILNNFDNECSKYMKYKNDQDKSRFLSRTQSDEERNNLMVKMLREASENHANQPQMIMRRVCHVLAANYWALEAYVPAGSIFEMGVLYEFVKVKENWSKEAKTLVKNTNQNYVVDSVLMNFAYAVEHFYLETEKGNTASQGAIDKFGKYSSRLFKIAMKLTDIPHKECWIKTFQNYGLKKLEKNQDDKKVVMNVQSLLDDSFVPLTKAEVGTINNIIKNLYSNSQSNSQTTVDEDNDRIKKFVLDGYECVFDFGTKIIPSSKKNKKKTRKNKRKNVKKMKI